MIHETHVTVEAWPMDCIEGECEHIDEETEPFDMARCPSFPMEVCVDCMVARGHDADPKWWEGAFDPWPHPDVELKLVPVAPAMFHPRPD